MKEEDNVQIIKNKWVVYMYLFVIKYAWKKLKYEAIIQMRINNKFLPYQKKYGMVFLYNRKVILSYYIKSYSYNLKFLRFSPYSRKLKLCESKLKKIKENHRFSYLVE